MAALAVGGAPALKQRRWKGAATALVIGFTGLGFSGFPGVSLSPQPQSVGRKLTPLSFITLCKL